MEMSVLHTATMEDLLDELCTRCRSVALAVTPRAGEEGEQDEVSFRLQGDLMQRSGLVQALATAQDRSMSHWLDQ